jgi:hypothetical protein
MNKQIELEDLIRHNNQIQEQSINENECVKRCPTCGRITSNREISLYRGIISALARVYQYVIKRNDGYCFTRKEVKHLFHNENDTARFGDLVMFGGLVFKKSKAHYGLNMERCINFFSGEYSIPTKIIKNSMTNELTFLDYKKIHEIPKLTELLDEYGFYKANYR